jgi:hypothetical protein
MFFTLPKKNVFQMIDLAPLVEAHLPFQPEFGWPRPNARWPSRSKIAQIKDTGIHTVATDPVLGRHLLLNRTVLHLVVSDPTLQLFHLIA